MSQSATRSKIRMPTRDESRAIDAAARSDPDAMPMTAEQLDALVPLRALRGRPRSDSPKLLVSIRYSPDVIAHFRSTGAGWQSRMNAVLERYVHRKARDA
jgi:uncharacterized protein (DUF4415 family)